MVLHFLDFRLPFCSVLSLNKMHSVYWKTNLLICFLHQLNAFPPFLFFVTIPCFSFFYLISLLPLNMGARTVSKNVTLAWFSFLQNLGGQTKREKVDGKKCISYENVAFVYLLFSSFFQSKWETKKNRSYYVLVSFSVLFIFFFARKTWKFKLAIWITFN